MPIYNIDQHLGCIYYATGDNALFRHYCLSDGNDISGINENRSALLYLAKGSLQIELGGFNPEVIMSPRLVFLPKNIDFVGHSIGDCAVIACFFEGKIPLCNKYSLIDLQRDVARIGYQNTPPLTRFRK